MVSIKHGRSLRDDATLRFQKSHREARRGGSLSDYTELLAAMEPKNVNLKLYLNQAVATLGIYEDL